MPIPSRGRSSSPPSDSPPPSPLSSPKTPTKSMSFGVTNILAKMRQGSPKSKAHHIESSSGEPQTHPTVTLNTFEKTGPYELKETYICSDAVDMQFLLRTTRKSLLEHICNAGLNALVDEQWKYTICCPKNPSSNTFRIQISYIACCAQSCMPDPHKPVALDKIKSIPGLMTINARTY
ncbi:hypothetical protein H0H92_003841 [Tricholoma furcatifolium]|nr:hypothetical protein H0H92_003841 [Tricholoma furcatifolium]